MLVSALMSILIWLIKRSSPTAVHAVSLALSTLIKLIQAVPAAEYQQLSSELEAFLTSLVASLGTGHPAVRALAATPRVIANASGASKYGTTKG